MVVSVSELVVRQYPLCAELLEGLRLVVDARYMWLDGVICLVHGASFEVDIVDVSKRLYCPYGEQLENGMFFIHFGFCMRAFNDRWGRVMGYIIGMLAYI